MKNNFIKMFFSVDARWSERLRLKRGNQIIWPAAVFFAHSGDSWFCLLALSLIWLFGNPQWHNHAALMGVSTVSMALIVLTIKFIVRRHRPEGDWGAIYRKSDPHSFPSGHAARTALLAVMAIGLGPAWFGWMLLIMGTSCQCCQGYYRPAFSFRCTGGYFDWRFGRGFVFSPRTHADERFPFCFFTLMKE